MDDHRKRQVARRLAYYHLSTTTTSTDHCSTYRGHEDDLTIIPTRQMLSSNEIQNRFDNLLRLQTAPPLPPPTPETAELLATIADIDEHIRILKA